VRLHVQVPARCDLHAGLQVRRLTISVSSGSLDEGPDDL
jgi:hypothetical protein